MCTLLLAQRKNALFQHRRLYGSLNRQYGFACKTTGKGIGNAHKPRFLNRTQYGGSLQLWSDALKKLEMHKLKLYQ